MKQKKLSQKQIQGLLAQYCPHYYSDEHIDEILKRTPAQLVELFEKTKLSCVEQVALVEKAPVEVVETYIQTGNNLYAEAQIALVKRGDQKLIEFFIRKSFHGFSTGAEALLIRSFRPKKKDWWKNYLAYPHKLIGEAEIALIDTHDIDFLKLYLDDHILSDDACMMLLKNYTFDEISRLISECPRFYLTKEAEAFFVEKSDPWLVAAYFAKFGLAAYAQLALVKRGHHHLIMNYLDRRKALNDNAVIELAKRGDYDEVAKVMDSMVKLPWEAEVAIVRGENEKLFNLLNNKNFLSAQAEYALAKIGDNPQGHDRIMRYLEKRAIIDAGAIDIIMRRGNSEEIKACIRCKCLNGNAPKLLIERGLRDEIELFISISHPEWKIPE